MAKRSPRSRNWYHSPNRWKVLQSIPAAECIDVLVTDGSRSEIPNKDAGCNAVTHSGVIAVPAPENPEKPVHQKEDAFVF